jgi:hypothetical protein
LDFANTFRIGESVTANALEVSAQDLTTERARRLTDGDWHPSVPVRFRVAAGELRADIIGSNLPAVRLVSSRVVHALQEHAVTGWDTYEIVLEDVNGRPISDYHGLTVEGRCGPIDDRRSVRVDRVGPAPVRRVRPVWLGLYFADDSWDGSDIFRPVGTAYTFVVGKVRRVLEDIAATNVSFTALSEVERLVL